MEEKENKVLEEIKRHNEVLMEHMEQQVKTAAEQHGSVIAKLEKHDRRFDEIGQRFDTFGAHLNPTPFA